VIRTAEGLVRDQAAEHNTHSAVPFTAERGPALIAAGKMASAPVAVQEKLLVGRPRPRKEGPFAIWS
jgi:hypothetical protein